MRRWKTIKYIELYPSVSGCEILDKRLIEVDLIIDITYTSLNPTVIIYYLENGEIITEEFERMVDCERRYYSVKDIIDS